MGIFKEHPFASTGGEWPIKVFFRYFFRIIFILSVVFGVGFIFSYYNKKAEQSQTLRDKQDEELGVKKEKLGDVLRSYYAIEEAKKKIGEPKNIQSLTNFINEVYSLDSASYLSEAREIKKNSDEELARFKIFEKVVSLYPEIPNLIKEERFRQLKE